MTMDTRTDEPVAEPGRFLVTGATGTVGAPLVEDLLDRGLYPRVATRHPADAMDRFGPDAEFVEFHFDRPETWGNALDHVDRVFLLYPPGGAVSDIQAFADAADRVGVDRIVFLSVLGAETLPILPHRQIENHLARTEMTSTFLRASWFMQNLAEIHRPEIRERGEIFVPAGSGELSFTDARDVAEVAATVLTENGHGNRAYDVTGPATLDFSEVAAIFSDVLKRPITYADPSPLCFGRRMYRRGFGPGFIGFMIAEYTVIRLGFSGRTTNVVESILGREPRSVREFVTDYASVFDPGTDQ